MKSYKPDRRSMNTLRAASAAAAIILITAFGLLIPIYSLMITLIAGAAAAAVIVIFVYLPMYFSSLSYTADEDEISKTSGAVFRKKQSVKLSSVQHYTLISTPLSERTGLNFIILYVYGGRIFMPYLSKADANEIIALSEISCRR